MQPDELQGIWKQNDRQIQQIPIENQAITQAKTHKSTDIIYQFRRTLVIEAAVSAAMSVGVVYFAWHTLNILTIAFLATINIWYLIVVIDVLRRISACSKAQTTNIYLQNMLKTLQGFVSHYRLVCYVIVPVSAFVGVYWSVQNGEIHLNAKAYYIMGGVVIVVCALVFPFCYWWIHYFYQRKINKIKSLITQLNESE
jgi:hypothetical protein